MSTARATLGEIGVVFVGGMLGTAARYGLSLVVPPWGGLPLGTFVINVVGAFALGWLVEVLGRGGDDSGRRRTLRLFAGTGLLGGFTTYSAIAVDTNGLLVASQIGAGVLYGVATVIVGAAASIAGIAVGALLSGRRSA